jgi:hypothetical protein
VPSNIPSSSYGTPTSGSFSSFGSSSHSNNLDSFNIGNLFSSRTQFSASIPSITYGSPKGNGDIQGSYSSISNSVSYPDNSQLTTINSYGEPTNKKDSSQSSEDSFHVVSSQYNTQSPNIPTTPPSNILQRRHKESLESTDSVPSSNLDEKLKGKKVVVNDKLNAYLKYIAKSTQKPDIGFQAPTKTFSFNYEESPSQVNDSLASLSDNSPINHRNNEYNSEQNPSAHTYSDNQWKITESL